ncbi:Epimerase family protein SDR39U1, partial [Fragariocoptes setiger]
PSQPTTRSHAAYATISGCHRAEHRFDALRASASKRCSIRDSPIEQHMRARIRSSAATGLSRQPTAASAHLYSETRLVFTPGNMPKSIKVLIGGGSGFIGKYLTRKLQSQGAKVKIITRSTVPRSDQVTWSSIRSDGLPPGTDCVVNLAGNKLMDPLKRWNEEFKNLAYISRVETTRLLANSIDKLQPAEKPKSFLVATGVGYYKPSDTFEYNENSGPGTSSSGDFISQLAVDWEKASKLNDADGDNVRQVIIRPGAVIGRDGGVLQGLYLPYLFYVGGPVGSGKQWFPWIHVQDLANMFVFSIFNNHVAGIINGVAPQIITNAEFSQALGRAMNRPSMIPMPEIVVKLLFGNDRAVMMLQGQKVKSRAELLGFRYDFPYIDIALADCVK